MRTPHTCFFMKFVIITKIKINKQETSAAGAWKVKNVHNCVMLMENPYFFFKTHTIEESS